jgi:alkylation response protein AidB-like acyl-CoA dehydrogenase
MTVTSAVTVPGIRSAIAPVLARLAATARQREQDRTHPFGEVRALAQHGILLLRVPAADGGAGGTLREVLDVVIEIARADSNVAQALRSSFLTADSVVSRPDQPYRDRTLVRIHHRDLFAGTSNERGGAPGSVATTVHLAGDGYLLNGTKYYSTGGLYAAWFSGNATDESGAVVRFTVPTDRPGVQVLDDFDAVGQRLTASGTTRLTNVRLAADEVIRDDSPHRNSYRGSVAQLYLAAVEAGIAQAVLDDAVWFARNKARPIKHSSASQTVDDPYVQHVVGEIAARRAAARSAVLIAAEALDASYRAPDETAAAAGGAAAITVAQAQFVAVEFALRAAELLFDVGGGSATDRAYGFDRHWRNARTVANHNPRDWKAAAIGAYHLSGTEPPTTGLF